MRTNKWKKGLALLSAATMAVTSAPVVLAEEEAPTKFKIAVSSRTGRDNSFLEDENGLYKQLEKKLNVEIEWQFYDNWDEKKALILMGEDMPDAFWGNSCFSASDVELNKELFLELTDLIDENMPNLKKAFEEDVQMKYHATNLDGEIYGLPNKLPSRPDALIIPWINKTWLDNLGLSMPTNYKELQEVLRAFKEQDANGNGDPNDEIPFSAQQNMDSDMNKILLPFNVSTNTTGTNWFMHLDENGTPVFAPATENYKEAVKWMHELYEEGLTDPEAFTMDGAMQTAKQQGDVTGLVYWYDVYETMGDMADQFVPLVFGDLEGNIYLDADDEDKYRATEFVVSKTCENPEKLLQWVDEFYADEAGLQVYFGSACLEVQDDSYYLTDPNPLGGAWNVAFRDYGPKYCSPEGEAKIVFSEDQPDGLALKYREEMDVHYDGSANCAFPWVKYTLEESEELGVLRPGLKDYTRAKYAEWVVNGTIEEEWDTYLAELEGYGMEEYVQIHTDAYNRYLAETK